MSNAYLRFLGVLAVVLIALSFIVPGVAGSMMWAIGIFVAIGWAGIKLVRALRGAPSRD